MSVKRRIHPSKGELRNAYKKTLANPHGHLIFEVVGLPAELGV
jgi:hypothetical protein